jgi:hypothetical protein
MSVQVGAPSVKKLLCAAAIGIRRDGPLRS